MNIYIYNNWILTHGHFFLHGIFRYSPSAQLNSGQQQGDHCREDVGQDACPDQPFKADEEMQQIASLDKGRSAFFSPQDPAIVEWFGQMVEERKKQGHHPASEKKAW